MRNIRLEAGAQLLEGLVLVAEEGEVGSTPYLAV